MQEMDGKTHNIVNDNIQALMQIFPDAFSEGKVDYEKLQLLLGENIIDDKEKYSFTWKGKNDAIKVALAQNTGTLRPDKKSSKNWDTTQNLYIEGDNLEVLRTLQDSYRGKVKMIYIDPPYNTGNDYFIYPDNYGETSENYKQKTEQDMKSNPDTSGRFHSDWLSMMYPRLKLARNLLKKDGVIFISIGDEEISNLKKITDEIFGEDNIIGQVIIHSNPRGRQSSKSIAGTHEYLLIYGKSKLSELKGLGLTSKDLLEYNKKDEIGTYRELGLRLRGGRATAAESPTLHFPIYVNENGDISLINGTAIIPKFTDGTLGTWRWSKEKILKDINLLIARKVKRGESFEWDIFQKDYISDEKTKKAKSLWNEKEINYDKGASMIKNLFLGKAVFDYSKPLYLLEKLLKITTNNLDKDIILDFFSGSGTTAHAIMQLNAEDGGNRKHIMVQLPELTYEKSEAYKAGYKNICEIGKKRIRRAGEKILEENKEKEGIENLDVGFKVFKLDTTNLKKWEPSIKGGTDSEIKEQLQTRLTDMTNPVKEDREQIDMIYEIMLKNGMDLTLPMEELDILGKKVFSISSGYLIACLENNINLDVIKKICELKPKVTVFYDNSFEDDVVKLNAIKLLEKQDNEGKQEIQVRVI